MVEAVASETPLLTVPWWVPCPSWCCGSGEIVGSIVGPVFSDSVSESLSLLELSLSASLFVYSW